MIRGDAGDAERLSGALEVVRSQDLRTDAQLASFLQQPPPNVDPAALHALQAVAATGGWVLTELGVSELPTDLRWLYESGAVTLPQLAALYDKLDIVSAADIIDEARRGRIAKVTGVDAAVEQAIAAALPRLRSNVRPIPLGRAVALAEPLVNVLRTLPNVDWAEPIGSLRRGQDLVGDVEIVASTSDPAAVLSWIGSLDEIESTRLRSAHRIYVTINRTQVGIRCPEQSAAAAALLHLTGTFSHLDQLRRLAEHKGLLLDHDGLSRADHRFQTPNEEAIYRALELPFIAPELRDGQDEIELAQHNQLPSLITRSDIRGDLHVHTHWSDGRDSIEAMVQTCIALGYSYVAITDHSARSAASHTLSVDDVARQADEIASLRERYPGIAILHGCEVDIMSDGRLDFPDHVLGQFDIVLASLHDDAGQSPEQLLRRYVNVMRHPLVTMITHPMNRMVPHRRGYPVNFDQLCEAAVQTRTFLEIDGSPSHLDLEGSLARRAVEAGVTLAIDSDAHRTEMLDRHMNLGVTLARRGRVEPGHVLNTRPLLEIRALIAAKRRSG